MKFKLNESNVPFAREVVDEHFSWAQEELGDASPEEYVQFFKDIASEASTELDEDDLIDAVLDYYEGNVTEPLPEDLEDNIDPKNNSLIEAGYNEVPGQISIFDNYRKFVELPTFRKDWRAEGLTEDDLRDLQNQILNNPETAVDLGDKVFKIRFAPKSMNKGKSGAYRIFYIDIIMQETIYLVGILDKADAANLSKEEVDALRKLSGALKIGGT